MSHRVLYIQYNNPGAYPPIIHSSNLFHEKKWRVSFVGVADPSTAALRLPESTEAGCKLVRTDSGLSRFFQFHWASIMAMLKFRPDVLYVSDRPASLAGWMCSLFTSKHVIYHEHDCAASTNSMKSRLLNWSRHLLMNRAQQIIIPSADRSAATVTSKAHQAKIKIVMNCPSTRELGKVRKLTAPSKDNIKLYYHGSIVPNRIPLHALLALNGLEMHLAGYMTEGTSTELRELLKRPQGPLTYHGALASRNDLAELMVHMDVGLSFMPLVPRDLNEKHMAGASNKTFDYLAHGLGVLCTDTKEWRDLFGHIPSVAFCDPMNHQSIEKALRQLTDCDSSQWSVGEQWIHHTWNYERQFQPVLDAIDVQFDRHLS